MKIYVTNTYNMFSEGEQENGLDYRSLDTPETPRSNMGLRSNSQSSLASAGLMDNPQDVSYNDIMVTVY